MSDRIAVMNKGVIEQVEGPEDVYERPRTTFVAGFIGVSNLMPGEVVAANGKGADLKLDCGPDGARGRFARHRRRASAPTPWCARRSSRSTRPASRHPAARHRVRGHRPEHPVPGHGHADGGVPSRRRRAHRARAQRGRGRTAPPARPPARPCAWRGRRSTYTWCARQRPPRSEQNWTAPTRRQLRERPGLRANLRGGASARARPAALPAPGRGRHRQPERDEPARRVRRRRARGWREEGGQEDQRRQGRRRRWPSRTGRSTSTSTTRPRRTPPSTRSRRSTGRRSSTSRRSTTTTSSSARCASSTPAATRADVTCTWSPTGSVPAMERLGYVQKFDKSQMPNAVKNIEPAVASPDFDPKREVSMPWQSGQVGLVYRSDKTGGELTSRQRPVRPEVQGQGHHAHRDARHRGLGAARATGRSRRTPTSTPH